MFTPDYNPLRRGSDPYNCDCCPQSPLDLASKISALKLRCGSHGSSSLGSPTTPSSARTREGSATSILHDSELFALASMSPPQSLFEGCFPGKRIFEKVERPAPVSFTPELVIATPQRLFQAKPVDVEVVDATEDCSEICDTAFEFEFDFEVDLTMSSINRYSSKPSFQPDVYEVEDSDLNVNKQEHKEPTDELGDEKLIRKTTKFQSLGSRLKKIRKSDDNLLAQTRYSTSADVVRSHSASSVRRGSLMTFRDPFRSNNSSTLAFDDDFLAGQHSRKALVVDTTFTGRFGSSVKRLARKITSEAS